MLLMIVNRRPHSCEAAHVETKIQCVGPEGEMAPFGVAADPSPQKVINGGDVYDVEF